MHVRTIAAVTAAVVLATGCSGSSPSSTVPVASQPAASRLAARSGVAPRFLSRLRFGTALPGRPDATGLKELGVSDFGSNEVILLNQKYKPAGKPITATDGLSGPDGEFVDTTGNLFVANYAGVNVEEFALGSTTASTTYSSGLTDPVDVTTDTNGNVYVADNAGRLVVEYAPGASAPSFSCSTGLETDGVAVDNKGDVFVSGNANDSGQGSIIEYTGGLSGCAGTTLGITLGYAGGLQIDTKGDLIACDQFAGVDIIPKPYTAISSTITGAVDAFHIALTKNNKTLYIADPDMADVLVDSFPAGKTVKTLGAAQGLTDPAGVATYPFQKPKKVR
jgi:hypothetical protein